MKRYALLIIISLTSLSMFTQDKYISPPSTFEANQNLIDSIVGQYINKEYKLIVYRPSSKFSSFCSILVIESLVGVQYWCFKDTITISGKLNNNIIFKYKDYLKTGVMKNEITPMKFIPPLMCQEETESLIFESNKERFYFESENAVTYYEENPKRLQYRKKWLEIIRSELKNIL